MKLPIAWIPVEMIEFHPQQITGNDSIFKLRAHMKDQYIFSVTLNIFKYYGIYILHQGKNTMVCYSTCLKTWYNIVFGTF